MDFGGRFPLETCAETGRLMVRVKISR